MRRLLFLSLLLPLPAWAEAVTLTSITEWKAVQAQVETRDRIPARARLGGTLVDLAVTEGDEVQAGQVIALLRDDKLAFQLSAIDARLTAAQAQLANAEAELARGESLKAQGVTTAQRMDQLQTALDVARGQIATLTAERHVIEQQVSEGRVLAPVAGRVIDVPATKGAVLMPGEIVAQIAGGGTFLRLALPERHAETLSEGDAIQIEGREGTAEGRLEKLYPLIQNGRVLADVALPGLKPGFVGARVLVRLPVGQRLALLVPAKALTTAQGLDFVTLTTGRRVVVPGEPLTIGGREMVEILSGLEEGDILEDGK